MKIPALIKSAVFPLFLWLALFSVNARADINSAGLLDNVLNRYSTAASTWAATITMHATWLFWTLAIISMVWTFGMMALRKGDIGEFFAEFIRFTVFTGFFWWLLTNGPNFATSIMNSLRTIGGNAAGTSSALTPSGVVDIGFNIFSKMIDQSSVLSPLNSAVGITISVAILVILALIGVNMLLLLVSGWILAYAGIFFLGFGGSRWTSDMAINYFKTVLSIAAQLLTMVLLVGIGKSFIDLYYTNMNAGIRINELGVMLVVAVVLLALVNKVPALIGQLAMGGGTGSLGSGFGAGAVVGAAAMGAAAASTAGAALVTGTANMAGGAHALIAAFSKANATETASGGAGNLMMPSSGQGNDPGGRAFASAMGGDQGGGSFGTGNTGASDSAVVGSNGNTKGDSKQSGSLGSEDNTGSQSDGASASSDHNVPHDGTSFSEGDSGDTRRGSSFADYSGSGGSENSGGGDGKPKGGDDDSEVQGGNATSKTKSGSTLAAAGAAATKIGRLTAGTVTNLAQGTWDVTKAKGSEMIQAARDRVGDTTGGKIAASIKVRDAAQKSTASIPSTFDDNSLSAGTSESPDADSEVAAFRDRDSKDS